MNLKSYVGLAFTVSLILGLLFSGCSSKLSRDEASGLIKDAYLASSSFGVLIKGVAPAEVEVLCVWEGKNKENPVHRRSGLGAVETDKLLGALQKEGYLNYYAHPYEGKSFSRQALGYDITMLEMGKKKFQCVINTKDGSSALWALYPVCDLEVVITNIAQEGPRAVATYSYKTKNFRGDVKFLEPIMTYTSMAHYASFVRYDRGWKVVEL